MNKKHKKLISLILLILFSALLIKTHYDYRHKWEYRDFPINQKYDLASSEKHMIMPHKENPRFYVKVEDGHIDDRMSVQVENRGITKGFLIK